MRDQSKAWQSRVEQLIRERLNATDAQTWQKAIVIGSINDENTNGYQCLWLSTKVAALEKIVANDFQATLNHRDDVGPTYWLNAVNGEVDMTDVFKTGVMSAHVYINGGGSGMVKVKGHTPIQNGTVTFQLVPP
jgi:hypothetical protein